MAKKKDETKTAKKKSKAKAKEPVSQEAPQPEAGGLPVIVHAQYLRDISFENPNAPMSLRGNPDQPNMDINIGMDARKLEDDDIEDLYEVLVNVRAEATREDGPMFLVEMQYGMTVSLQDVPEEQHHPLLLIEIPRLAFPYVRQIMSDMTIQGGYPPLLLAPVDFQQIYMQRFAKEIEESQKTQEA